MSHELFIGVLVVLILLSAFFSSAETSMMALNKYRLRYLVRKGNRHAKRTSDMLSRPDRLISTILIGNNFVNILASSLVTVGVIHLWGEGSVAIASLSLTFVILIFGEITPKTLAAMYPEKMAFAFSLILLPLYKLLTPVVIFINWLCAFLMKPFGIFFKEQKLDRLNSDELRSLVNDACVVLPKKNKSMLLGILDLDTVRVDDIMVPRNDMVGIDINKDITTIIEQLQNYEYSRIPIYQDTIDNMIGVLHLRGIAKLLPVTEITKEKLLKVVTEPHYVPVSTTLYTQLINFQKTKQRSAFVVDEYGEILGIVNLEDILEEIVGEFNDSLASEGHNNISECEDGSYIIDGATSIRAVNRQLNWNLPCDEVRTINGLITEVMEAIPYSRVCWRIGEYYFEILQVKNNRVKTVKMFNNSNFLKKNIS